MLTHLSRIPLNEKDLNNSIKRAAVFLANSRHERDIYHHTDSTAIKYVFIQSIDGFDICHKTRN